MSAAVTALVAAVVLAGVGGALLPSGRVTALARLDPARERPRRGRLVPALAGWVAALSLLGVLPALLLLLLAALAWGQVRRGAALRLADRTRDVLGELASGLVAELRSGAEPRPAIVAAASGLAGLETVVEAAAGPSGDVARALSVLGRGPGGSTAADLAAAWRVGELTGCGLAVPVARVLRGHRAQDRLRRELAAELAGPTATAYLLAALPLVGISLGTALGADPVGFLLGTSPGRVVLSSGVALNGAGLVWTRRIAGAAAAGCLVEPAALR